MATASSRTSHLSHNTQSLLNSYKLRLQEDIRVMLDNFTEIVKSAKVPTEERQLVQKETQGHFDVYQMKVRAANIVRAGESLLKLISDLKTFVILNDFPSINENMNQQNAILKKTAAALMQKIIEMRDEFCVALTELESEHYNSLRLPIDNTATNKANQ